MRKFLNSFTNSLKLPSKKAVFALNRIGMDIAVIYMFFILALASIPALVEQVTNNQQSDFHIHPFFFLIYFFIFYYLILTVIVFLLISLTAYIGTLYAKFSLRKLRFSILWKIVAFSTTLPLILFTIFSITFSLNYKFLGLTYIYIIFVLIKVIYIYPKRRNK